MAQYPASIFFTLCASILLRIMAGYREGIMDARMFYQHKGHPLHPFQSWKLLDRLPGWIQPIAKGYLPALIDPWHNDLQARTMRHQLAMLYMALLGYQMAFHGIPLQWGHPLAALAAYHLPFSITKIIVMRNNKPFIDFNMGAHSISTMALLIFLLAAPIVCAVAYGADSEVFGWAVKIAVLLGVFLWAPIIILRRRRRKRRLNQNAEKFGRS